MDNPSKPHKLEDYEPGATKKEVFDALRKVAVAKKKPKKSASPI